MGRPVAPRGPSTSPSNNPSKPRGTCGEKSPSASVVRPQSRLLDWAIAQQKSLQSNSHGQEPKASPLIDVGLRRQVGAQLRAQGPIGTYILERCHASALTSLDWPKSDSIDDPESASKMFEGLTSR